MADPDPKALVEHGYDTMAELYLATFVDDMPDDPRLRFIAELTSRLTASDSTNASDNASTTASASDNTSTTVLELGCGAGIPATALLAQRFDVLGVDISATQLALAAERVPSARFRKADMTALQFPNGSFDAVVAFYCFNHLPLAEQPTLITKVATWLRPGGLFLANSGVGASADAVEHWLGVPMFFASGDLAANRRHLAAAGLVPRVEEVLEQETPLGRETWQWVIAER